MRAERPGDPNDKFDPGLPFDEHTVKDVHSMSKVITAAAMLKALGDSGGALDAPIWPYMPGIMQDATPGADLAEIPTITFRNLLDHTSGLGGSENYSWGEIKAQLAAGLKNDVGDEVFAPTGLPAIHPRPVPPTIDNFGLYYDFPDPDSAGVLMPDRRLTVGSGGWALSAKQYGKFISGLFNNQVVSGTQLGWMRDGAHTILRSPTGE